jgi:tape measure domain-containing protein
MNNIYVVLRLLNQRRFAAGLRSSAAELRAYHAAVTAADTNLGRMAATSHLATSGLYAIGSAARSVGYGIGALAASTAYFGVQFNATMESNNLAFEQFAGGAKQAKALTMDLFEIAKSTPFSFTDITTAERRFLAFGFSVKQSISLLNTLGDTLSFTGGSTDEILRMAKALGDIQAKGRLMGQEFLQLTNLNLPIHDILQEQLGLTEDDFKNLGRAAIPAQTAIAAIQKGLEKRFGGGAQRYLETFNGQLQRLQDNLKFAAGQATGNTGFFVWLKSALKFINDHTDDINKFLGSPKFVGIAKAVGNAFATAIPAIVKFVGTVGGDFLEAIKPAQPFLENVLLPLLKGVFIGVLGSIVASWKIFIFALKIAANIFGYVGAKLEPLRGAFELLGVVLGFVFGPGILGKIGQAAGLLSKLAPIANLILIPMRLAGGLISFVARELTWAGREAVYFLDRMGFIGTIIGKIVSFGAAVRTNIVGTFTAAVNCGG